MRFDFFDYIWTDDHYAAVSLISTDSNFSDDANISQADKGGSRLGPSLASSAPVMTANRNATSLLSAQIDKQNSTNNNSSNSNNNNRKTDGDRRRWSTESNDNGDVQHHKLTREDSERPIASEKIKKKSHHADKDV